MSQIKFSIFSVLVMFLIQFFSMLIPGLNFISAMLYTLAPVKLLQVVFHLYPRDYFGSFDSLENPAIYYGTAYLFWVIVGLIWGSVLFLIRRRSFGDAAKFDIGAGITTFFVQLGVGVLCMVTVGFFNN